LIFQATADVSEYSLALFLSALGISR